MLPGKPAAANSIYRIVPEQGAAVLAQFPAALVLSMAYLDGEVVAGTGVEGRLIGVKDDGTSRILTDLGSRHLSAMARDSGGGVLIGGSNAGGLWRLGQRHRDSGTFVSKPFDAGYLASWGRVWWKANQSAGTAVAVQVRTGNSRKPDATWCEWSKPTDEMAGASLAVPMGQFAQVRIELRTREAAATPQVVELAVSYLQANRRPQVQQLVIDGQAEAKKGQGPPPPPQQQAQQTGKRNVVWQATDPNEDELTFDLHYRGVDEKEWKELETDIRAQNRYEWDTTRVPEGHYLLRLVASDRLARAEGDALAAERVTPPFVIDNRRPDVLDLKAAPQQGGRYLITGTARDGYSNVREIQVSRNSKDWLPVFPDDRIFDSPTEAFSFRTEVLEAGEHVFVFAATDEAGNAGSARLIVTVK